MLDVEALRVRYGTVEAVKGVSFSVADGAIVSLIGANGAGKTTSLRALTGLIRPSGGALRFEDRSLVGLAPHDIVRLGIAHVPEGRRLFPKMTVLENLEMGAFLKRPRPELLMLDEPSMGLSPIMTAEIGKIIRQINASGVSIILVEQNAMLALTLAGYGYVLETGRLVLQGPADDLLRNEGVRKAYLGI